MQFNLLSIYQMFLTVLYFYSQFRQYCDTNCLHPQWIPSATIRPVTGAGVCLSSLYHWLACCRRQYISNTSLHFKDTCWCQSCIVSNYCIYCGNCIKRNEGNLFLVGSSIKVQDDTLFPKHIELSNNMACVDSSEKFKYFQVLWVFDGLYTWLFYSMAAYCKIRDPGTYRCLYCCHIHCVRISCLSSVSE